MKKLRLLTALMALMLAMTTLGACAEGTGDESTADEIITLTFGGDCVLGTRYEWQKDNNRFGAAVEENGLDYPFSQLSELFATDDITLINLECVLQDEDSPKTGGKEYIFRGKAEYAEMLPRASIEIANVANNHFIDYRQKGRESTLAALDAAQVPYCGYKNLYVFEIGGYKIGFGGCRETVYKESKPTVYRDIQALKKQGCDVIIYSCHWGKEYSPTHNKTQINMAQYAVNSGADIVVGTHPHVVQGIESYEASKGKRKAVVIYSLGNLVFGGTHDMTTFDATLAQAKLHFQDGKYTGASVTFIPVLTSSSAPENDFCPMLAEGEDEQRILKLIQDDSEVTIEKDMWFPIK